MTKCNEYVLPTSTLLVIGFVTMFLVILPATNYYYGGWCKIKTVFSGDDFYCYHLPNYSNTTYSSQYDGWEMRSHKQDAIDAAKAAQAEADRKAAIEAEQTCYDVGYNISKSFDIIAFYNLTCPKLQYINDHWVDSKTDGGYIHGESSGSMFGIGMGAFAFGSSQGSIDGKAYIMERVSATGQLVQNVSYHINCRNETLNMQVDYYSTPEFVMYYVDKCIGGAR